VHIFVLYGIITLQCTVQKNKIRVDLSIRVSGCTELTVALNTINLE